VSIIGFKNTQNDTKVWQQSKK